MNIKTVRMIISQPRLGAVSEWSEPIESLNKFRDKVGDGALRAGEAAQRRGVQDQAEWDQQYLKASEKACQFCKAKATCPALAREVLDLFDHVEPEPDIAAADVLGDAMAKVKLVEGWCKAIRAETERRLLAGVPVPGYKLVQGRRGNRRWGDEAEVTELFKGFKLKTEVMYDLTLISPTTAEKLAAENVIGPRRWAKVLPLITQSEGSPSVAPESDKRPALPMSAVTDEFDDLTKGGDIEDLL